MKFIIKVIITALSVWVADYFVDGVHINNDAKTIVIVALVLALLNSFVRPILIILTIPVTIYTLGLFLLIINALMVKWAAVLVKGFTVDNWSSAIIFSLIVSLVTYILYGLAERKKNTQT